MPNPAKATTLDVPEGKYGLTPKTFAALNYSYARYGEEADWFMKADDDVFVVWENLVQFLARYDATRPHYIGAPSPPSTQFPQGYNSGGAGCLISKPAASALLRTNPRCRRRLYAEDMAVGKCLEQLKVFPTNTLDDSGRQRFHSGNPTTLFRGDPTYMKFFYINFTGIEFGNVEHRLTGQMLSSEAITFHYASPEQMYTFEYLLRGLRRAALEMP